MNKISEIKIKKSKFSLLNCCFFIYIIYRFIYFLQIIT